MKNPMIFRHLLLLTLILIISSAQPYSTLVAPLKKDPTTSLFTIILNSDEPYVVDLSAAFSWRRCPSRHPTVACFTTECIQATYLLSPTCSLLPPPSTSDTPCTCMVTPVNPIARTCEHAQLTSKNLTLSSTNGAKIIVKDVYLSCASSPSIFRSFPKGALGLASLSLAPLSLPSQFSQSSLGVSNKFALCLPSTSVANGVAFFGDGPYKAKANVSSVLTYTPLLRNPKTADLFIGINALSINGNSIPMSPFEGIKLSTVVPYTTLRTDVYKLFIKYFEDAMKGVQRAKNVKPFTSCYRASSLHAPRIDLEFGNGTKWTIFGANSLKKVGGDSSCVAFLDGGETADYKVVVGSYQMEDNFLLFDLEQSRLGFATSLYSERISCSNFNRV